MDHTQDGLSLSVTVPASEWAQLRRRVTYLEAVLTQVLHGQRRIKEWFSAAELTALRLPGLPATKAALTRLARSAGWTVRTVAGRGGQHFEYHFYSLPHRAFDALIARVVSPQIDAATVAAAETVPAIPAPPAPPPRPPDNATPAWVLPLMRVIRREAPATVREALDVLPRYLPKGVQCPTADEATAVLRRMGMVS